MLSRFHVFRAVEMMALTYWFADSSDSLESIAHSQLCVPVACVLCQKLPTPQAVFNTVLRGCASISKWKKPNSNPTHACRGVSQCDRMLVQFWGLVCSVVFWQCPRPWDFKVVAELFSFFFFLIKAFLQMFSTVWIAL